MSPSVSEISSDRTESGILLRDSILNVRPGFSIFPTTVRRADLMLLMNKDRGRKSWTLKQVGERRFQENLSVKECASQKKI